MVVIGVCLWVASVVLGVGIAVADPFAFCGLAVVVPLTLGVAWIQYRGTFHRVRSAARMTSFALYGVGGLLLLGVGTLLGEVVAEGISLRALVVPLLGLATAGAFSIALGYWNANWAHDLSRVVVWGTSKPQNRFSLRELLGAMAVVAIFTATTVYFSGTVSPQWGEGLSASESGLDLPLGASNVSCARGARGLLAYEFDCDEEAFCNWFDDGIGTFESEAACLPLREITSPVSIPRYQSLHPQYQYGGSASIANGLYYQWTKDDRGVYAAYDRDAGRGYFYLHTH